MRSSSPRAAIRSLRRERRRTRAFVVAIAALLAAPAAAGAATNGPIAYVRTESAAGSDPQIWLMGPTGSAQGQLTPTTPASTPAPNFSRPSFSNSGSLIAYAAQGPSSPDIFTMNFSGSGVADLAPDSLDDSSPALSPDGTKIAYTAFVPNTSGPGSDYEIFVRPVAGGAATQLTNNGAGVDDLNPAWSPDGTKIAFASTRSGSYDIWVMDAASGANPTALTNTMSTVSAQFVREQYPAWSPDGSTIAYTRMESNQINDLEAFDIWEMAATGANQHKLAASSSAKDTQPAWSPDGTKIVFASDRSSAGDDIWTMDAAGNTATDLTGTASPVSEAQPVWGTPQGPSTTWTGVSPLQESLATVNAKIAVSCLSGTWYVEWSQGTQLPLSGGAKTATQSTSACAPTAVSNSLTGLSPSTTYTARVVVQNSLGTAATDAHTFTTPAASGGSSGGGSASGPGDGTGQLPFDRVVTPPFAAPPRGTPGDDRLIGTAVRDVLRGAGGEDVLAGLGGNDLLDGGSGRDILDGGSGNDRLIGGSGDDDLDGGRGNDRVEGGSGNDIVRGGPGNDRLIGGSGVDRFVAGAGDDFVDAKDGHSERVDCGAGKKDYALIDRTDKVRGCERVARSKR